MSLFIIMIIIFNLLEQKYLSLACFFFDNMMMWYTPMYWIINLSTIMESTKTVSVDCNKISERRHHKTLHNYQCVQALTDTIAGKSGYTANW